MWNDFFFQCMSPKKENILFFSIIENPSNSKILDMRETSHVGISNMGYKTACPSSIGNAQRGNYQLPFRSCKPWVLGHISPFPKRETMRSSLWIFIHRNVVRRRSTITVEIWRLEMQIFQLCTKHKCQLLQSMHHLSKEAKFLRKQVLESTFPEKCKAGHTNIYRPLVRCIDPSIQ